MNYHMPQGVVLSRRVQAGDPSTCSNNQASNNCRNILENDKRYSRTTMQRMMGKEALETVPRRSEGEAE
jgi:predicted nucleic acid-binding Zn ribbon protein